MSHWTFDESMKNLKRATFAIILLIMFAGCEKPGGGATESLNGITINEVSPSKLLGGESWFELLNRTSHDIAVNGMTVLLTDDKGISDPVATVSGITVPANGYFVISNKEFKFSRDVLRSTMEEIGIQDSEGSLVNSFSTKYDLESTLKPEDGGSYARIPDGGQQWTISNIATPGAANYKIVYKNLFKIEFNEVCRKEGWVELTSYYYSDQNISFATIGKADGTILYTVPDGTILPSGGYCALDFDCSVADTLVFKDNLGDEVSRFCRGNLTEAPTGGSWSRLPNVSGDFVVTETATKAAPNKSITTSEIGMVLNEVCLVGGWIEIANSTVRTISSSDMKIYGKSGGNETLLASVGKKDFEAGSKTAFDANVNPYESIILKSSSGDLLDTFEKSKVKDSRTQTATTSWSRIPDMTGNWYTVVISSKGEDNAGITEDNSIAIWLNYSSMNSIDLDQMVKLGIGHIILHEYGFVKKGKTAVDEFITEAHKRGLKVHIWLQCFWWNDDIKWRSAVIDRVGDTPASYNQPEFDDIISRALTYLDSDIDGLHLDYVRFGGTAYKHDWPEDGITGIGSITEFCRQFSVATRAKKSDIILSAALMGETNAQKYYGQEPGDMTKYLDILMPMAYISSYNYSDARNIEVANWFKSKAQPDALVWHGISTYDSNTHGLTSAQILHDCVNITKSNADGIALFRYGLGDLPDLNALYRK